MNTAPLLDNRQQSIITISAFTASGDLKKLDHAINEGLNAGLRVNEIKEILVQLYAYTGFPRSLNGLATFMEVLKRREKQGILDEPGPLPSSIPEGKTSLVLGEENQTKLVGFPVTGPLFEFAPAIDTFLKAHLFGDIFARDNIDWINREIATIGALANMKGVDAQLQAHLRIGLNTGLTPEQLREIIAVLKQHVSQESGNRAETVLSPVFSEKKN